MEHFRYATTIVLLLFIIEATVLVVNDVNPTNPKRCGGVILSDEWILTSAKCVHGAKLDDIWVSVGGRNFLKDLNNRLHRFIKVSKNVAIGEFDPVTSENDVALLKLKTKLHMKCALKAAQISKAREFPDDLNFTVVGWGTTFSNESYQAISETPQTIDVRLKDSVDCSDHYSFSEDKPYSLPKSKLCAGNRNQVAALCKFDDGAPLFYMKGGEVQIVGVASLKEYKACALFREFIPYTNVISLRLKITELMNSE